MFRSNANKNQPTTSGSSATPSPVVSPSQSKIQGSRPKTMLLGLVIVVCLIAAGVFAWNSQNNSKNSESAVCNDERLSNASGVLKTENIELLMPIAEEIQKLPNYDKDPNCLNVVVTYYIHISDSKNARAELDKLEVVYKEAEGFSSKLGNDAKSIDTLRSNVSFLEEQQKQMLQGGVIPSPKVEQ